MKKFIVAFSMIMISAVIVAQSDYYQFTKNRGIYFTNYTNNQVIGLNGNHHRIASVALHNPIYFNDGMIRIGIPYPKEIKRINKKIAKRNKEIYKQNEKNRKNWEKENKKARKERDKQIKKYNKRVKKNGKWY